MLWNALNYPGSYGFWAFAEAIADPTTHEAITTTRGKERRKLLSNALLETLRLHPVASLVRANRQPVEYVHEGTRYIIPTGGYIGTFPYHLARSGETYADPTSYDPTRFTRGEPRPSVFGRGAYSYVAQRFIKFLLVTTMEELLDRFEFELEAPLPGRLCRVHLLYPDTPVRARLTRRAHAAPALDELPADDWSSGPEAMCPVEARRRAARLPGDRPHRGMSAAPRPGVCATAAEAAREIGRAIGPALGEGFADHTGWTAAPAGGPDDAIFWREVPGAAMVELKSEATIEADPLAVAALIREADLSTLAGALRAWAPVALSPFHQWVYYVSGCPRRSPIGPSRCGSSSGWRPDDVAAATPSIWILGEDLGNVERARAPRGGLRALRRLPRQLLARSPARSTCRRTACSRSPRAAAGTQSFAAGSTWTSAPASPAR